MVSYSGCSSMLNGKEARHPQDNRPGELPHSRLAAAAGRNDGRMVCAFGVIPSRCRDRRYEFAAQRLPQ